MLIVYFKGHFDNKQLVFIQEFISPIRIAVLNTFYIIYMNKYSFKIIDL